MQALARNLWRAGLAGLALGVAPEPAGATEDVERDRRMAWFHEAKYGLFTHWRLYAIPAGEWLGRRLPSFGEWIMSHVQ